MLIMSPFSILSLSLIYALRPYTPLSSLTRYTAETFLPHDYFLMKHQKCMFAPARGPPQIFPR